jgi:hypothetical protein
LFQVIFWVGHEQYVFFAALYLSKDKQLVSSNFAYRTRKRRLVRNLGNSEAGMTDILMSLSPTPIAISAAIGTWAIAWRKTLDLLGPKTTLNLC